MDKKIIRAGSEIDFKKKIFKCNINVSDICNFSCSYCINSASKNKNRRILDKRILGEFIDDVALRKFDSYNFSIAGGEPLLYPHIKFLVEKISKSIDSDDITVAFATNGSRLSNIGFKLYEVAKSVKLHFLISVHLEQVDLNSFVTDIAKFGHKNDINCKILLAPGKLAECKKILKILSDNDIATILQIVTYPGGKPFEYTSEELEFLEMHNTANITDIFHEYTDGSMEEFDRITRSLHPEKLNYGGMHCMAGANTLRLGPDGEVTPCFGAWSVKNEENWRYNISNCRLRDIPELNRPRICPSKYCGCLTFVTTPKWIPGLASPGVCAD